MAIIWKEDYPMLPRTKKVCVTFNCGGPADGLVELFGVFIVHSLEFKGETVTEYIEEELFEKVNITTNGVPSIADSTFWNQRRVFEVPDRDDLVMVCLGRDIEGDIVYEDIHFSRSDFTLRDMDHDRERGPVDVLTGICSPIVKSKNVSFVNFIKDDSVPEDATITLTHSTSGEIYSGTLSRTIGYLGTNGILIDGKSEYNIRAGRLNYTIEDGGNVRNGIIDIGKPNMDHEIGQSAGGTTSKPIYVTPATIDGRVKIYNDTATHFFNNKSMMFDKSRIGIYDGINDDQRSEYTTAAKMADGNYTLEFISNGVAIHTQSIVMPLEVPLEVELNSPDLRFYHIMVMASDITGKPLNDTSLSIYDSFSDSWKSEDVGPGYINYKGGARTIKIGVSVPGYATVIETLVIPESSSLNGCIVRLPVIMMSGDSLPPDIAEDAKSDKLIYSNGNIFRMINGKLIQHQLEVTMANGETYPLITENSISATLKHAGVVSDESSIISISDKDGIIPLVKNDVPNYTSSSIQIKVVPKI